MCMPCRICVLASSSWGKNGSNELWAPVRVQWKWQNDGYRTWSRRRKFNLFVAICRQAEQEIIQHTSRSHSTTPDHVHLKLPGLVDGQVYLRHCLGFTKNKKIKKEKKREKEERKRCFHRSSRQELEFNDGVMIKCYRAHCGRDSEDRISILIWNSLAARAEATELRLACTRSSPRFPRTCHITKALASKPRVWDSDIPHRNIKKEGRKEGKKKKKKKVPGVVEVPLSPHPSTTKITLVRRDSERKNGKKE